MPETPKRPWFRRPGIVVLLVVAVLLVALLAVAGWLMLRRPLTLERWASVAALEKAGLERGSVTTADGDLAVWSGGTATAGAPSLVFLHGAGDHAGAWAATVEALAAMHRVVVPDLPGHGDSQPAEGTLPMATVFAGVVDLLCSDLVAGDGDATAPIVVGNSLGGWLALLVGAEHPELASRLVVVNGGATEGPRDPALLLPSTRREAASLLDLLGSPGPIPGPVLDDVVRNVQEGALARFMAAGDHLDFALTGRLGEVTLPVDLVWGELDGYLPLDYAEATAAALPASRLTVIDNCGHVPERYCPERFTEVLGEVLAESPPKPRSPAPAPEVDTASREEDAP